MNQFKNYFVHVNFTGNRKYCHKVAPLYKCSTQPVSFKEILMLLSHAVVLLVKEAKMCEQPAYHQFQIKQHEAG